MVCPTSLTKTPIEASIHEIPNERIINGKKISGNNKIVAFKYPLNPTNAAIKTKKLISV